MGAPHILFTGETVDLQYVDILQWPNQAKISCNCLSKESCPNLNYIGTRLLTQYLIIFVNLFQERINKFTCIYNCWYGTAIFRKRQPQMYNQGGTLPVHPPLPHFPENLSKMKMKKGGGLGKKGGNVGKCQIFGEIGPNFVQRI